MAGRILPVALAIISGVSIGVATFDGEFKEQRRQRLQEEYDQEVAAAAAAAAVVNKSAVPTTPNVQSIPLPAPKQSESSTSWSSMLGLWAWKKDDAKQVEEKRGEEKS